MAALRELARHEIVLGVGAREARKVGELAVRYSMEQTSGSVAMRRKDSERYEVEYFLTSLESIAKVTRHMDASYIIDGNNISESFKRYVAPLVGPLPNVGTFDELT